MNYIEDKVSGKEGQETNRLEQKISKTSHGICTLFQVAMAIAGVAVVALLIGISVLIFLDEAVRASFFTEFEVLASDGTLLRIIPENLFSLLLALLVNVVLMWLVFYTVRRIFREISQNCTLFRNRHIVCIKRISLMVVAMSIISGFSGDIFDLCTVNKMSWGFDLAGVLLGVVTYCLAIFFDYGCQLQQQSDETL